MTISPLFKRITLIRYDLGDRRFSATGFFFLYKDTLYIATNKHVFEHELGISPEEIRILFWKMGDQENPNPVTIPMKDDDGSPRWITHEDEKIDLALLSLEETNLPGLAFEAFTMDDFYDMNPSRSKLGRDAMVVGYPAPGARPIKDSQTSYPVAVSAMISSEYGSDFDHQPFFLIDADSYDGMSGSPVMIRPGPDFRLDQGHVQSGESSMFLGIHSGPYEELPNLDLNRVWYPHLLMEIVDMNSRECDKDH